MIADELGYTRAVATASLGAPRLRCIRAGLGLWHVNFRAVLPALAELVAPLWNELARKSKHTRKTQILGAVLLANARSHIHTHTHTHCLLSFFFATLAQLAATR